MKAGKPFNRPLAGTLLSISAPQVAEIISDSGFDWVLIDMEHSAISLESVQNALQIMGDKILKIVRVPAHDEIWIKRVLDTGCDGIFGMTAEGMIPEMKDGCTFLLCGVDAAILVNSYKDLLKILKTGI